MCGYHYYPGEITVYFNKQFIYSFNKRNFALFRDFLKENTGAERFSGLEIRKHVGTLYLGKMLCLTFLKHIFLKKK